MLSFFFFIVFIFSNFLLCPGNNGTHTWFISENNMQIIINHRTQAPEPQDSNLCFFLYFSALGRETDKQWETYV